MKKIISLIISLFAVSSFFAQASLDNEVYKKITSNVFEVIVEKHEDTKIVYEKELPVDRIPFAIRKDKYMPIGTAFLLNDGSFYSAAHVINLYGCSVYDKYFIRDAAENVYEINEILLFSQRRDFIKFTVKDFKFEKGMGLEISNDFTINSTVFSVGNALGEGIIIRNGSLTSQTYEEKNGDWKWLRFSAAASPGNSGGPLIQPDGKVIGIVTMKSENENLNYALPITEVFSQKADTGIAYKDARYLIPNILNYKHPHLFEAEISLPKTISQINKELTELHQETIDECIDKMKKDYAPNGTKAFENSNEADEFFYQVFGEVFPLMIYINQNGKWNYGKPNNLQTYNLEDNGFVEFGSMFGYYFARIHKPDSLPLKELIENQKVTMDYLCKAFSFNRNVYGEQVNITSFGECEKEETYKDYFGRTWYFNYYALDFTNAMAMTISLPTPTGIFVLVRISTRDDILRSSCLDAQFMTDFVYPSYGGKIKYWREYLSLPENIKSNFSPIEKKFELKESPDELYFSAGDITLSISKKDVNFNDESQIKVFTGFSKEDDKLSSEIRSLLFSTSTKEDDYKCVSILCVKNPGKNAKDELQKSWKQFANQVTPYNDEPYNEERYTYLDRVIYPQGFDKSNGENADYLYLFCYEIDGQNRFDEIKEFADNIQSGITTK